MLTYCPSIKQAGERWSIWIMHLLAHIFIRYSLVHPNIQPLMQNCMLLICTNPILQLDYIITPLNNFIYLVHILLYYIFICILFFSTSIYTAQYCNSVQLLALLFNSLSSKESHKGIPLRNL